MQMRAVKLMKSREEFKKTCEEHVDIKLQLSVRRAKHRKEIQKLQRALKTMLKTQQTLALELEKIGEVRKQIQASQHYSPKLGPVDNPKNHPDTDVRSTFRFWTEGVEASFNTGGIGDQVGDRNGDTATGGVLGRARGSKSSLLIALVLRLTAGV